MARIVFIRGRKATLFNTALTPLTDNSGGVAVDGTIAAVNSSATAADAIKELATQQNAIIAALKAAKIIL